MKDNQDQEIIKKPTLRSIQYEFSEDRLTQFGGMSVIRKAMDSYGLSKLINKNFDVFNFRKKHSLGTLFEQVLMTMMAGGTCIHDTKLLNDAYLQRLFGWESIVDDGTLSRRFSEFNAPDVKKLRNILRKKACDSLAKGPLFISIDPTVETVYGTQEGAEIGYNPSKQGRRSYFPFIAYEYSQGRVLDAMLRPGNTASSTDLADFIDPLLKIRGCKKLTFRLDKGCTTNEVLGNIEEAGQYYVGKAKMVAPLWEAIHQIEEWEPLGDHHLMAQFFYKGRRHVVVEQLCTKKGEQLNLWGKSEARMSVVVTNRPDRKETIWRMYNKGAMVETSIKELKYDFSALDFRTKNFETNEVFLLIGTIAWNIAKKVRSMPELKHQQGCRMKKLRWMLLNLPAMVTTTARYIRLKLPRKIAFPEIVIPIFRSIRFT